ncbi:hypothetical protein N7541_007621 [Penicillium brevicompactum]|uniref:Scramblase-domain-containing protein n=1 Tax=Penicillium brevicompactum TaxID=5074 RepID=A0A9W9R0I3_PENBR|nr:hypothetical protein N7541_007621 [Penicillium brevicompactum]
MWSLRLRPLQMQLASNRFRALSSFKTHGSQRGPRNSIQRPDPIQARKTVEPSQSSEQQQPDPAAPEPRDAANPNYDPSQNTLLAPVHIPEDPNGVLKELHPATSILANSGLVVQRQLEMMNVMIGFEQANKYIIMDAQGNHIGYMAEQEKGLGNAVARQSFRTHRSFVTHVFDRHENEVLRFHRPFAWINSKIHVYDPLDQTSTSYSPSTSLDGVSAGSLVTPASTSNARVSPLDFDQMRVIGEAQQQWAPLRRKYNLFTHHRSSDPATDMGSNASSTGTDLSQGNQIQLQSVSDPNSGHFNQFAFVDEPFLSWDFSLKSTNNQLIGSVNRNFAGFAREFFTDTGVYAMRMDSAGLGTESSNNAPSAMSLDQRAVMLATAVSIDFDYFSRHSGSGGFGFMPLWFPGMGGEAAAGGAAAGGAAEAGAVGEAATGTLGRAAATGGMGDGMAAGVTGAGAMAGYDAMQRGHSGHPTDPNSQAPPGQQDSQPTEAESSGFYDEPQDPWGQQDPWGDGSGGDAGEGGDSWSDFF